MRIRALVLAGLLGGSFPVVAQPTAPEYAETIQVTASCAKRRPTRSPPPSRAHRRRGRGPAGGFGPRAARRAPRAHARPERLAGQGGLALRPRHELQPDARPRRRRAPQRAAARRLRLGVRDARGDRARRSVRGRSASLRLGGDRRGRAAPHPARAGRDAPARRGERSYRRAGLATGFVRGRSPARSPAPGAGGGELPNDGFDGGAGRLRLDWQARPGLTAGLAGRWQEAEIGLPYDFFGAPATERRQESELRHLALPVSWQTRTLTVSGSAARVEQEVILADPHDPFAASRSEAWGTQLRATAQRHLGEQWELAAGAEWERQRASSADAFGGGLDGARERRSGGFVQTTWRGRVPASRRGCGGTTTTASAGRRAGGAARSCGCTTTCGCGRATARRSARRRSATSTSPASATRSCGRSGAAAPSSARKGRPGPGGWPRPSSSNPSATRAVRLRLLPAVQHRPRPQGLETEARATFAAGWLRASHPARSRGPGDRRPLLRRPRTAAALAGGVAAGQWALHGGVRYVGERTDVGSVELAAYTVAEAGVSWRATARIQPYARVENLFDRAYEEVTGYPAPGRTWIAGVAFRAGR